MNTVILSGVCRDSCGKRSRRTCICFFEVSGTPPGRVATRTSGRHVKRRCTLPHRGPSSIAGCRDNPKILSPTSLHRAASEFTRARGLYMRTRGSPAIRSRFSNRSLQMKHIYRFVGLCVGLALPALLAAQSQPPASSSNTLNHAEIGVYGDYFRFTPSSAYHANFLGVGGRVGFNMNSYVAIEAEMNYDFAQDFTTSTTNGTTTTIVTTSVRPLTGLFGPKLQFGGGGPFRVFATGKVGFIDFSTNNSGVVSGSTFTGAVAG